MILRKKSITSADVTERLYTLFEKQNWKPSKKDGQLHIPINKGYSTLKALLWNPDDKNKKSLVTRLDDILGDDLDVGFAPTETINGKSTRKKELAINFDSVPKEKLPKVMSLIEEVFNAKNVEANRHAYRQAEKEQARIKQEQEEEEKKNTENSEQIKNQMQLLAGGGQGYLNKDMFDAQKVDVLKDAIQYEIPENTAASLQKWLNDPKNTQAFETTGIKIEIYTSHTDTEGDKHHLRIELQLPKNAKEIPGFAVKMREALNPLIEHAAAVRAALVEHVAAVRATYDKKANDLGALVDAIVSFNNPGEEDAQIKAAEKFVQACSDSSEGVRKRLARTLIMGNLNQKSPDLSRAITQLLNAPDQEMKVKTEQLLTIVKQPKKDDNDLLQKEEIEYQARVQRKAQHETACGRVLTMLNNLEAFQPDKMHPIGKPTGLMARKVDTWPLGLGKVSEPTITIPYAFKTQEALEESEMYAFFQKHNKEFKEKGILIELHDFEYKDKKAGYFALSFPKASEEQLNTMVNDIRQALKNEPQIKTVKSSVSNIEPKIEKESPKHQAKDNIEKKPSSPAKNKSLLKQDSGSLLDLATQQDELNKPGANDLDEPGANDLDEPGVSDKKSRISPWKRP